MLYFQSVSIVAFLIVILMIDQLKSFRTIYGPSLGRVDIILGNSIRILGNDD